MNMSKPRLVAIALSTVAAGALLTGASQLGPLTPPPGEIANTEPTLTDLEDSINAIEIALASQGLGPTFTDKEFLTLSQSSLPLNTTVQVINGPLYLHSIIMNTGRVSLIDSDGQNVGSSLIAGGVDAGEINFIGGSQYEIGMFFPDGISLRRTLVHPADVTIFFSRGVPNP